MSVRDPKHWANSRKKRPAIREVFSTIFTKSEWNYCLDCIEERIILLSKKKDCTKIVTSLVTPPLVIQKAFLSVAVNRVILVNPPNAWRLLMVIERLVRVHSTLSIRDCTSRQRTISRVAFIWWTGKWFTKTTSMRFFGDLTLIRSFREKRFVGSRGRNLTFISLVLIR